MTRFNVIIAAAAFVFSMAGCRNSEAPQSSEAAEHEAEISQEKVLSAEPGTEVTREDVPSAQPEYHQLSVPGLRSREYSAGTLTLLDEVPAREGLCTREFSYVSEGFVNYGLIERPAGPEPEGGWPVIILAHGYIQPDHYSTVDNYRMVSRYYAKGGFLVVKPDFRGHGRSEGYSDMTATWIFDYTVDTLNLLARLDEIPGADTDNVFLYGHSMGGEIALRIMMVDQEHVRGTSLWAAMSEDFPENLMFYVGGTPESRKVYQAILDTEFSRDEYYGLSLSPYIDSIETPMIIHQGTEDVEVPLAWTQSLVKKLDEAGAEYTYYEYPGEDHNISGSFYTVLDRDMAFFRGLMQ